MQTGSLVVSSPANLFLSCEEHVHVAHVLGRTVCTSRNDQDAGIHVLPHRQLLLQPADVNSPHTMQQLLRCLQNPTVPFLQLNSSKDT
jgi:hypothetical protein